MTDEARAARLDNIRWLAETGGCANDVADRIGITPSGLEHALTRAGEHDLLDTLRRRNPADHNSPHAALREALRQRKKVPA